MNKETPSSELKNLQQGNAIKKPEEEIWKFLTRAEKINRTIFPDNSSNRLILQSKKDGFGFIASIPESMQGKLPMPDEEVLNTIRGCNKIVNNIYCMKRRNDEYDFLESHLGFIKFIFLITFLGFILLAVSDSYRSQIVIFYIGLGLLAFAGVLVIIIATLLVFREKKHINLMQELTTKLQKYFESQNREISKYRGAAYILEPELRWVELEFADPPGGQF